jgi:hypothetical protein
MVQSCPPSLSRPAEQEQECRGAETCACGTSTAWLKPVVGLEPWLSRSTSQPNPQRLPIGKLVDRSDQTRARRDTLPPPSLPTACWDLRVDWKQGEALHMTPSLPYLAHTPIHVCGHPQFGRAPRPRTRARHAERHPTPIRVGVRPRTVCAQRCPTALSILIHHAHLWGDLEGVWVHDGSRGVVPRTGQEPRPGARAQGCKGAACEPGGPGGQCKGSRWVRFRVRACGTEPRPSTPLPRVSHARPDRCSQPHFCCCCCCCWWWWWCVCVCVGVCVCVSLCVRA